jgi:hypothetical protein
MLRRCLALALAAACGDDVPSAPPSPPAKEAPGASSGLPDRVKYDQILIAFQGSYERVNSPRRREDARSLAHGILDRLRSGIDFGELKQEYSDDRSEKTGVALGPYETVKDGVPRQGAELPLSNLHKGLAEVVYRLKVGEVGIVEFDADRFPIGWLVVKRLE